MHGDLKLYQTIAPVEKSLVNDLKLSIDSLYIQIDNNLNIVIDSKRLHELRSCSKLLVAMAMGIAIENNLFSLEESAYDYIENYITNDNNKDKKMDNKNIINSYNWL